MKHKLKKISIVLIIIVYLTTIIFPSLFNYGTVYAANAGQAILDGLTNVLGLFVGLGTIGIRLIVAGVGAGITTIISAVAGLGGEVTGDIMVTPVSIFFNKLAILDVDFFEFAPNSGSQSIVTQFRETIATWYYIMRTLATAILLIVLIYVGIRMAIATVASEKALYKKMLIDWVASIALIYLLHYFIILIITINKLLVDAIAATTQDLFKDNGLLQFQTDIMKMSISPLNGFAGIVCSILFAYIVFQTIKFLFIYIKRMMTVGFLIIVAPLITLTYSMDKMGDGKAQALGTWLKEFCYNILIQPFHCILYLAFVYAAVQAMQAYGGLGENPFNYIFPTTGTDVIGAGIFSIMCLNFIDKGEDIIRKIFGFQNASSLASTAIAAGVVTSMASNAAKYGQTGAKMFNHARADMTNKFKRTSSFVNRAAKRIGDANLNRKTRSAINKNGNNPVYDANNQPIDMTNQTALLNTVRNRSKNGQDISTGNETQEAKEKREKKEARKSKREEAARNRQTKKAEKRDKAVDALALKMAQERHKDLSMDKEEDREKIMAYAAKGTDLYKEAEQKYDESRPKARIKAAQGFLNEHGVTGDNVKKYVGKGLNFAGRELKDSVPGAMALLGATANFAGTGKVLTSITAGIGAYEGTEAALKNSKSTMKKGVDEDIQMVTNSTGIEFNSKQEKQDHIASVVKNGDLGVYSGANVQKFANDVIRHFQSVASKLQDKNGNQANITSADITSLNAQANALMRKGLNGDDAFEMAFQQSKFANTNITDEQKNSLKEKTLDYATFTANASLYNKVQQARGAGMNPNDLATGAVITVAAATMTKAALGGGGGSEQHTQRVEEETEYQPDRSTVDEARREFDNAVDEASEVLENAADGSTNNGKPVRNNRPINNQAGTNQLNANGGQFSGQADPTKTGDSQVSGSGDSRVPNSDIHNQARDRRKEPKN